MEKNDNKDRYEFLLRKADNAAKDNKGSRVTNQRPSIAMPALNLADVLKESVPKGQRWQPEPGQYPGDHQGQCAGPRSVGHDSSRQASRVRDK